MLNNLKVMGDKVLVELHEDDLQYGSIVIPESCREGTNLATVVAVGNGRLKMDGKRTPPDFQVGDEVVIDEDENQHITGEYVTIDDNQYLFIHPRNILAKVARENE